MIKEIYEKLSDWYSRSARDLPWRHTADPYAIWISEVMLQQTRAAAVIPYYERFLTALPDVRSLADVPEEELMKLWEGLGYYSRARNLQKAAKEIVSRFDGCLPVTQEALRTLPGFGPYTSASVAAFAFRYPAVPVDGNVLRLYARLCGIDVDIRSESVKEDIRKLASDDLTGDPALFGQMLIELGATVCTPKNPKCVDCPAAEVCTARMLGLTDVLPVRSKLRERRVEERCVLIIRTPSGYAIRRRPKSGLLAGLFEFPSRECAADADAAAGFARDLGFGDLSFRPFCECRHIFTHLEWYMYAFIADADSVPAEFICATPDELRDIYALPSAFASILSAIYTNQDSQPDIKRAR